MFEMLLGDYRTAVKTYFCKYKILNAETPTIICRNFLKFFILKTFSLNVKSTHYMSYENISLQNICLEKVRLNHEIVLAL